MDICRYGEKSEILSKWYMYKKTFFPLEKLLYNWKLTCNTIILLYDFPLKDSYLLQYQQIMIFFGHDFNQLYSILTFYNTSIFTLHELINCMILI